MKWIIKYQLKDFFINIMKQILFNTLIHYGTDSMKCTYHELLLYVFFSENLQIL